MTEGVLASAPGGSGRPKRPDPGGRHGPAAGQNSEWQAIVVISGPDGSGALRERFSFALDSVRNQRRAGDLPPIDPILVVALALCSAACSETGLTLAGRSLPRTLRETSRPAVLGGNLVGGVLGVCPAPSGDPAVSQYHLSATSSPSDWSCWRSRRSWACSPTGRAGGIDRCPADLRRARRSQPLPSSRGSSSRSAGSSTPAPPDHLPQPHAGHRCLRRHPGP